MQDDLPFSPPSGLPQQSKLATYMARGAATTAPLGQSRPLPMPATSLGQAFAKLSLSTPSAGNESLLRAPQQPLYHRRPLATPGSALVPAFATLSLATPSSGHESSPWAAPPAPVRYLELAFGDMRFDAPGSARNKVVISEFVPLSYPTPLQLLPPAPAAEAASNAHQFHQENVGGTTYFYTNSVGQESLGHASALNSTPAMGLGVPGEAGGMRASAGAGASPYAGHAQMYAAPHLAVGGGATASGPAAAKQGLAAAYYTPEALREEIQERNADVFRNTNRHQYPDLPDNVDIYTELRPLEAGGGAHVISSCFRGTHRETGEHYALRRLHGYAGAPSKLALDAWRTVAHPGVVRFHTAFTTNAFGDHSMVLVYDYHPSCVTMKSKYLAGAGGGAAPDAGPFSDPDAPRPYTHQKNAVLRAVACGAMLPEAELWGLLVQLTGALRAVHHAGLALRKLDASKVVMTGSRLRLAWCGVPDALRPHPPDLAQAQQEDMTALGRLALALAARSLPADNLAAALDLVARSYSADLNNLIVYLLSTQTRRTITDLMPMIGARYYTQVEVLQRRADALEAQLARELDNGRLLRILVKLGVVNERPELNMDPSWSETGDRYMLKLFRDYLFHAVTADGRPWVDLAHITDCLNKLDGGSDALVQLTSRDNESALIVTYAELKRFLEQAVEEVMQGGQGGGP